MGYYTQYELTVTELDGKDSRQLSLNDVIHGLESQDLTPADAAAMLKKLKNGVTSLEISAESIIAEFRRSNEDAKYALSETGCYGESCKWYDHEKDLREFSRKYPKWLFTLKGEGEESGDIWKLYVVNGRAQKAAAFITFDEFSPSKLT